MKHFARTMAVVLSTLMVLAGVVAAEPTTLYLVRHAEKQKASRDPSLSDEGTARAAALARVLADGGIDAVYATQFARTRETAQPLADRRKLEVIVDEVSSGDIEAYARRFTGRLLAEQTGRSILIVGHSNTLPVLIRALGVDDAPSLTEEDYDDLFVVTVYGSGLARLSHLHYGPESP